MNIQLNKENKYIINLKFNFGGENPKADITSAGNDTEEPIPNDGDDSFDDEIIEYVDFVLTKNN